MTKKLWFCFGFFFTWLEVFVGQVWFFGGFFVLFKYTIFFTCSSSVSGGRAPSLVMQKVTFRGLFWQKFRCKSAIRPGSSTVMPWIPALRLSLRWKEHSQSNQKLGVCHGPCTSFTTHAHATRKTHFCGTKWKHNSSYALLTPMHKETKML